MTNQENFKPILIGVGSEQIVEPMFSFDKEENEKIKKMFIVCDTATNPSFMSVYDYTGNIRTSKLIKEI